MRILLCLLFLFCGCSNTENKESIRHPTKIVIGEIENINLGYSSRMCIKLKDGRYIVGYCDSGTIIPKKVKITVDSWLKIEPMNPESD